MTDSQPFAGLKTFGFNCYVNSGLQCLAHLSIFSDYITCNQEEILEIINNKIENNDNEEEKKKNLFYLNLKNIFIKIIENKNKVVDPYHLLLSARNLLEENNLEYLFNGDHQDISEFVNFVVDFLHEFKGKELKNLQIKPDSEMKTSTEKITNDILKCCQTHYSKKFSFVVKKMSFFLINKVNCSACSYMSTNYETMNILYISIPESNELTLYDCLDNYCGRETMNDGWKCDECNNQQDNYKELRIVNAPAVLMICLIRNNDNQTFGNNAKKNTKVVFPIILNIDKYLLKLGNSTPKNYQLMAISNHYGNANNGHYISICKRGNRWYKYDDETVSEVSVENIITSNAYMLFYQQV